MRPVRVDKAKLLTDLKANRDAHRAIFEEAVEGYRIEAVKQLEGHIKRIKKGSLKRVYISMPTPADHTQDYDNAIGMLKMSIDDTVELDESAYRWFVMDQWDWKQAFLATNSAYSVTAEQSMKDADD